MVLHDDVPAFYRLRHYRARKHKQLIRSHPRDCGLGFCIRASLCVSRHSFSLPLCFFFLSSKNNVYLLLYYLIANSPELNPGKMVQIKYIHSREPGNKTISFPKPEVNGGFPRRGSEGGRVACVCGAGVAIIIFKLSHTDPPPPPHTHFAFSKANPCLMIYWGSVVVPYN